MKEQMREALDLYLKDYPISATVSDIFEAGYKASIPTNYIGNQTEAFESWYQKTYVHFGQANFHLNSYGEYVDDDIESSWCAWKAALSAVPAQEPAPTMSQFASKADYEAAISKQPAPVTVTLTGHQLRCALALINPDGETDIDQLEDYLTFGIVTHYDDAGVIGRGMACWNDDTDGVLPLDDALFEPAKQEGKWISVDTKLPELGEKVIGIYDGSLCAFMRVCAEDDNWCWAIGRNDLYDEFFYDADDDYQITHWMPLPLPPVKEVTE